MLVSLALSASYMTNLSSIDYCPDLESVTELVTRREGPISENTVGH